MIEDFIIPSDEFVSSIDVHTLLPQKEPFVMIGKMEHFDMRCIATSTTINESNIFIEDQHMSASGLTENIAQTCAARIGYINKYILKKGIQIGFIGAIKNLCVNDRPKIGDRIITKVQVMEEVFGVILANAEIWLGDKVLVSTEIKIAIKEES